MFRRKKLPDNVAVLYVRDLASNTNIALDMSDLSIEEIGSVIEYATDILSLRQL